MPDLFRVVATAVTTTNAVNVLAFDTGSTAVIRFMTICNTHTANTASVDVQLVKASATNTPFILFRYTQVTAQETVAPLSQPLALEGGDRLRVQAGQANQLHVVTSALETFN